MSETPEPVLQAQLQIADIEGALKVIDYACEQGAFKGWQVIQEVFTLRARLDDFIKAVAEQTPETPAE